MGIPQFLRAAAVPTDAPHAAGVLGKEIADIESRRKMVEEVQTRGRASRNSRSYCWVLAEERGRCTRRRSPMVSLVPRILFQFFSCAMVVPVLRAMADKVSPARTR